MTYIGPRNRGMQVYAAGLPLMGGVFSPSSIAGLTVWLKADALSLNDNDAVATWTDSSGNGYNATQGTGANRPTYKTNILNGKPIVRFNGTSHWLATATFAAELAQPTTIFAVAINNTADTTQRHIFDGIGASKRQVIARRNSSGTKWFYFAGSSINGSADDTNAHTFMAIFNGASSALRVNGASVTTSDPGANALDGLTVGSNNVGAANFWSGDIAEILVYNSALGATDRANVEEYLRAKYAVY